MWFAESNVGAKNCSLVQLIALKSVHICQFKIKKPCNYILLYNLTVLVRIVDISGYIF